MQRKTGGRTRRTWLSAAAMALSLIARGDAQQRSRVEDLFLPDRFAHGLSERERERERQRERERVSE